MDSVDTKGGWIKRKSLISKHIWTNMSDLIASKKESGTSLGIVKPRIVKKFICKPCDREWDPKKMQAVIANQAQGSLFDEEDTRLVFKVVDKLPYEFSNVFTTDDGMERTLMIEDWELGALYRNCLKKAKGDEKIACQKVKEKYFDYMVNQCDLHFFVGTTKKFHNVSPNPFIIIGTFYLPKNDDQQLKLFL